MNRESTQMLVEMPAMLGTIVTKRGRVLRDGGSKGASTLLKSKEKMWVATSVQRAATSGDPQSAGSGINPGDDWDSAHAVAAKLKSEFGKSIYVEPEGAGRFHEIVSPPVDSMMPSAASGSGFGQAAPAGFGSPFSSHGNRPSGSGIINGGGIGAGMFGLNSAMAGRGMTDPLAAIRPYWPSADDFMARPEADLLSQFGDGDTANSNGRKKKLQFSALRTARGWSELAESTQQMFEVEAAQLTSNGLQSQLGMTVVDEYSALAVLVLQPGISKALRRFIEQATASS